MENVKKKLLFLLKDYSILVFIVSWLMFSAGTGKSSIYILDESKNAQCSWEMMNSDDNIIPTFNGSLRTDKPAMHYYIIMGGYSIFGKNAYGARFFSTIAGAFLMLIIFRFARKYAGPEVALWTILILLSSILWVTEFHLSVPDPYLIFFLVTGFMLFYNFYQEKSVASVILMYLCFSLAFMTKGPVAVGLPGLIILIFLLVRKKLNLRYILSMKPFHGLLIFLITGLPWYIMVHQLTDGEWTSGFIFDHNIDRFMNIKEGHGGSVFITAGYYAVGMLPYIVFIPLLIKNFRILLKSELIQFSVIIFAVFLIFFSISKTKLPNYAMPSYPFLAFILAFQMSKFSTPSENDQRLYRVGLWILFAISLIIPAALIYSVRFEPSLLGMGKLGLLFIFMPLGIIAAIILELRLQYRLSMISIAVTFILAGLSYNYFLMPEIDSRNPVRETTDLLKESDDVKFYKTLNPSFVFNYGIIEELKDTSEVKTYMSGSDNILITSMKVINSEPEFWRQFNVVYSSKDLFDYNHTLILKGVK